MYILQYRMRLLQRHVNGLDREKILLLSYSQKIATKFTDIIYKYAGDILQICNGLHIVHFKFEVT